MLGKIEIFRKVKVTINGVVVEKEEFKLKHCFDETSDLSKLSQGTGGVGTGKADGIGFDLARARRLKIKKVQTSYKKANIDGILQEINAATDSDSKKELIFKLLSFINETITNGTPRTKQERFDILWICTLIHKIKDGIEEKYLADIFAMEAIRLMVVKFQALDYYPICSLQKNSKDFFDSDLLNLIANQNSQRVTLKDIQIFAHHRLGVKFLDTSSELKIKNTGDPEAVKAIYSGLQEFYDQNSLKSEAIAELNIVKSSKAGELRVMEEGEEESAKKTETPLADLKRYFTLAAKDYISWVEANRLSSRLSVYLGKKPAPNEKLVGDGGLFSSILHGKAGIARAKQFIDDIQEAQESAELRSVLKNHFSKHSRVDDHSLDTYLVKVIKANMDNFGLAEDGGLNSKNLNLDSHKDRRKIIDYIIKVPSKVAEELSNSTGNDADNAVIGEGEGEEKEQKPVATEATETPTELDNLKDNLTKAAQSYITWVEANRFVGFKELIDKTFFNKKPADPETSGGGLFSAFRHGETGIKRANDLIEKIKKAQDLNQLKMVLGKHFSMGGGSFNNHSLNTYLVRVLNDAYDLHVDVNVLETCIFVTIGGIDAGKKAAAKKAATEGVEATKALQF